MNALPQALRLQPVQADVADVAAMRETEAVARKEINRLAQLDLRVYESERKAAAKRLDWRVGKLDAEVTARRINLARAEAAKIPKHPPLAAGDTLALALDDTERFLRRFVVMPNEHAYAVSAFWAAHTHVVEHCYTTPRLAFLSPEAGSGKTHAMSLVGLLSANTIATVNASPAAIFRGLEKGMLTLAVDEIDTIFSNKGKNDNHEELRGVINAGYKQGNTVIRCVGQDHEVAEFPTFCPVALAGLGDLPDTIRSRAIQIHMKRRTPGELIEEYRPRRHDAEAAAIRDRFGALLEPLAKAIGGAEPELPPGIINRDREVWEPLVAIADAAGGHWPERARAAASALIAAARRPDAVSLGVRLLGDIRAVMGDAHQVSTNRLLDQLRELDGSPWADIGDDGLDARFMAKLLRKYVNAEGEAIESRNIRLPDASIRKGYKRHDFEDAWARYLQADTGSRVSATSATSAETDPVADVADFRDWHAGAEEDPF